MTDESFCWQIGDPSGKHTAIDVNISTVCGAADLTVCQRKMNDGVLVKCYVSTKVAIRIFMRYLTAAGCLTVSFTDVRRIQRFFRKTNLSAPKTVKENTKKTHFKGALETISHCWNEHLTRYFVHEKSDFVLNNFLVSLRALTGWHVSLNSLFLIRRAFFTASCENNCCETR